MDNIFLRRSLVCGIAILFLGLCITSSIGVNVEQKSGQLRTGELAWWKFDDGTGSTATDSSGHGYHGNVVGATWVSGGLDFDGTDDYVEFDTHSQELGMNKTDIYFVYIQLKSTGSGMLYSMSHTNPARAYLDIMLDSLGHIKIETGDETCLFDLTSTNTFNDGESHLVVMEFYGNPVNPTLDIYVDGNLEGTTTEWLCPMIDEDFLTAKAGRDSNDESDYFDGIIEDIKIYKNFIPNDPPFTPDITGPSQGSPGQTLSFTFNAEDPELDILRFHINWGDGETEMTGYVESGENKVVTHEYDSQGDYIIRAIAEDEYENESPEATHPISIPREKATNNILLLRLLERFPLLQELIQHSVFGL
jgi:hypothetical protein